MPLQRRITTQDITYCIRQWAMMINAGMPLLQSLEMLITSATSVKLRQLLTQLKRSIESGKSLSVSLHKHPQYFPTALTQLIHAGEQSGTLDTMLTRIADERDKTTALRKQVQRALWYPAMVVFMATIVTLVLLLFVVPKFQVMFDSFGATLPAFTQAIVDLSLMLQDHGLWIGLILILFILTGITIYRRSSTLRKRCDGLMLRAPLIGNLLQHAIIARSADTLAITFAAGMPLIQALGLVAKTNRNQLYQQALMRIQQQVSKGVPLHQAFADTHLFPTLAVQMIRIGEMSGTLEMMLLRIAKLYQEQVDHSIARLTTLLEPLLMSALGLIVGGLVIAMYLPIFKMGSVI